MANALHVPPPPFSFFLFLAEPGLSCHSFVIYFFSVSSPGGKKAKSFSSCLLQGKLKVRLLTKRLKECCGGCEGKRRLLPQGGLQSGSVERQVPVAC